MKKHFCTIEFPKVSPYKCGQSDAMFERPCKSPWRDFKRQSEYVRGFLAGAVIAKRLNLTEEFKKEMQNA